jgi:hypothetical protein
MLHVLSGHNRRHKSVIQAQTRAEIFLRHKWKTILGASDNVRLICSLSDMMMNTYDVVYDVVYCISYTISYVYTMSYTISYIAHRIRHCIVRYRMRYPFLLPLRFIQPVLPHQLRACASGFQLPCVLNPEHASASSPLHPPLRSFWGTISRSSTSRR